MPAKNKRSVTKPASTADERKLVNNLTISEARHLLQCEGGELDASQIAIQGVSIAVVAATCAYAIAVGNATVWHLALPMVGEYLVLLAVMPFIYLVFPHPGMKNEVVGSLRLTAGLLVIGAILATVSSYRHGNSWGEQLALDFDKAWAWVTDYSMHWPILAAMGGVLAGLPGRVYNLHKYGPPFYAVGLGCGMRAGVLFLGFFLLPFIVSGSATRAAWLLWALLLIAEVLAIVMQWDIQQRLKKIDGPGSAGTLNI